MEEKNLEEIFFWEIPEIDLNLRHYSGHPSDVIKKIKSDIEGYLSNPDLEENRTVTRYNKNNEPSTISFNVREIYSAVYNALNYYKNISYLPSAEYETGDTFLSNSIRTFNEDYDYLSQKYNSNDLNQDQVISVSGRIKSPLSFVDKVREKVVEYIDQGRDFRYFNESLRDLIGVRFIINPPKEIADQGLEAEAEYLYKIFYDLMEHHGITRNPDEKLEKGLYRFFPVNTRYHSSKSEEIKSRPEKEGFAVWVSNGNNGFYRPTKRIPEIEQPCVDSVTKDYVRWPKYKGYQSLHVCVIPYYSDDIEHMTLPNCIIPPACRNSFMEYQFRTGKQNEYAEHGYASHNSEYKPTGSYHRLAVPFYIEFDDIENLPDALYNPSKLPQKPLNYVNRLKLRNFGESFKHFYGPSFEEYFGIPFKRFRDVFGSQERNDILSKRKIVIYDEERDLYIAQDAVPHKENPLSIALTPEDLIKLKNILVNNKSTELSSFFSSQHLQDALIQLIRTSETSDAFRTEVSKAPGIKLYTLEDAQTRALRKAKSQQEFSQDEVEEFITTPEQSEDLEESAISQSESSSLDDDL